MSRLLFEAFTAVAANPLPNDVRWKVNETHVQFIGEPQVRVIATETHVSVQEVANG